MKTKSVIKKNNGIHRALVLRETTANKRFGNKAVQQEFISNLKFTINIHDNALIFDKLNKKDLFDKNLKNLPLIKFYIENDSLNIQKYVIKSLEHIYGYEMQTIFDINGENITELVLYKIYADGRIEYFNEDVNDDTVISSIDAKYLFTNNEKNVLYFFPNLEENIENIKEKLIKAFSVQKVDFIIPEEHSSSSNSSSRGGGKRKLKKYK